MQDPITGGKDKRKKKLEKKKHASPLSSKLFSFLSYFYDRLLREGGRQNRASDWVFLERGSGKRGMLHIGNVWTGTGGRCEGSDRYVPRMAAFGCMDDDAWVCSVVVDLHRKM